MIKTVFKHKRLLYVVPALVLSVWTLFPQLTQAAALTPVSVRLGRLGISAATGNDMLVTLKVATTAGVAKVRVTFPVGFTIATGTPTPAVTGFPAKPSSPTTITALPGTLTSAATSGSRTIVVSGVGTVNNTTLYGFIIPTGTVTNHATAGQYDVTVETLTSGDVMIDTATAPVYIYGGVSNADQITVNASVAANFSFSLSANTDTIPKVDPTTIQTSTGVNMVVSTNSALGYTAYVKSANAQLTSAASPGTPIVNGTFDGTPDTFAAGTTKYAFVPTTGTACSTCNGSLTYDAEYAGLTGTTGGAYNSTNFASFVSRNGYTSADTVSLKERAAVSNTIAAANDYTDTLTIVAAGNY